MTVAELRKLQRAHERAAARAEDARQARNAAVRAAIAEGWSHEALARATGLSRSRVGQIAING